jgi:DNA-binding GntR family transcriptional regulator
MTSYRHKSAADFATAAIRQMILTGELPPGARVDQNEMAASLDISRHPVRQAIERLAERGFVISRPHKSVVVAELSIRDMEKLYHARAIVEDEALRLAWPHYDERFVAACEAHLAAMAKSDRLQDLDAFMSENHAFHMAFFRPAENPHLLRVIGMLFQLSERYQRTALMTEDRFARAPGEHRAMLACVRAADLDGLIDACRRHNAGTLETVRSLLCDDEVQGRIGSGAGDGAGR